MGATFWTVIRATACGQLKPSMTVGNQKWKGAAPALSSKEISKKVLAKSADSIDNEADKMINEEPRAWIRKYFKAASEEYWLFLDEIKGIKDNRLSSSPTQAPNQDEEETDKVVPRKRVNRNKTWGEENKIKKRGGGTFIDGVWAH